MRNTIDLQLLRRADAMKIFQNINMTKKFEGGLIPMKHEHHKTPAHHIPPHERRGFVTIEFESEDWALLNEIFGDEDTASAAVEIIKDAPPEIQILAVQIMKIIKEVV